jgi:P2 family phage contractile tail tube protein
MSVDIGKIVRASARLNGVLLDGVIDEIELPTIETETEEDASLALIGKPEYRLKMEPLESTITCTSYHPELDAAACDHINQHELIVRKNVEIYRGGVLADEKPLIVVLRGRFKETPGGDLSGGELAEWEYVMNPTYYSKTYDGQEILALDVAANIYRVKGVDLLERMRANLGIQGAVLGNVA